LIPIAKALRDRVTTLEADRDAARAAIADLRRRVAALEAASPSEPPG
jgi:hypothetical protein